MFKKIISIAVLAVFMITSVRSTSYAQSFQDNGLPPMSPPGVMVQLSPDFMPAHLQGITIHPENALQFDFLIHKGDQLFNEAQKKIEYKKLVKYFLASLTIPDEDQWVNLSPYEHDRIIKDDFGKTEMGRDLLAQDYMLKQITSSLIYPEEGLGRRFWDKVYARAWQEYHTTNIPVNTFNKVWIVPDQAVVYESGNTAYILKSHLKVMLEEDYLSLNRHSINSVRDSSAMPQNDTHGIGSQVIREVILPELEKEVNTGKSFANLRQMYSGMILATWYKRALKETLLGKVYADKAKVKGVDQDPQTNERIYQRYLKAFKEGVFNYIKEDVDQYTHKEMPRKYFSGGWNDFSQTVTVIPGVKFDRPRVLYIVDKSSISLIPKNWELNRGIDNAMDVATADFMPAKMKSFAEKILQRVLDIGPGQWVKIRDAEPGMVEIQRGLSGSKEQGDYVGDGVLEAKRLLNGDVDENTRSVSIASDQKTIEQATYEDTYQYAAPFAIRASVAKDRLISEMAFSSDHKYIQGLRPSDITQIALIANRSQPILWATAYLQLVDELNMYFTPGSRGEQFYNEVMRIRNLMKLSEPDAHGRQEIINVGDIKGLYNELYRDPRFFDEKQSVVPLQEKMGSIDLPDTAMLSQSKIVVLGLLSLMPFTAVDRLWGFQAAQIQINQLRSILKSENPYLTRTLDDSVAKDLIAKYKHRLNPRASLSFEAGKLIYRLRELPPDGELRLHIGEPGKFSTRIFEVVGIAKMDNDLYVARLNRGDRESPVEFVRINGEGVKLLKELPDGVDLKVEANSREMTADEIAAKIDPLDLPFGVVKPKIQYEVYFTIKNIIGFGIDAHGYLYTHDWYKVGKKYKDRYYRNYVKYYSEDGSEFIRKDQIPDDLIKDVIGKENKSMITMPIGIESIMDRGNRAVQALENNATLLIKAREVGDLIDAVVKKNGHASTSSLAIQLNDYFEKKLNVSLWFSSDPDPVTVVNGEVRVLGIAVAKTFPGRSVIRERMVFVMKELKKVIQNRYGPQGAEVKFSVDQARIFLDDMKIENRKENVEFLLGRLIRNFFDPKLQHREMNLAGVLENYFKMAHELTLGISREKGVVRVIGNKLEIMGIEVVHISPNEETVIDGSIERLVDAIELRVRERYGVDEVVSEQANGGIDFNAGHFDLQIKRYNQGVSLPLVRQDMAQLNKIQGLDTEIIAIHPAGNQAIITELQHKLHEL
jgi:hypothetical protein